MFRVGMSPGPTGHLFDDDGNVECGVCNLATPIPGKTLSDQVAGSVLRCVVSCELHTCPVALSFLHTGIENVPQAITKKVEAKHNDHDG